MRKAVAELCADDHWHPVVGSLQSILELQKVDTALLQLAHHQLTLVQRSILAKAKSDLTSTQKSHSQILIQLKSIKDAIGAVEAANKKCEVSIQKYSQQLKTVIAPREAEALQHEIATVRAERSSNDDKELQLLESSEQLDSQILALADQIRSENSSVEQATTELNEALKVCEDDKRKLEDQRLKVAQAVEPKLMKIYDVKRNKRTTPAVADLHGTKCQSCHLDLSVVELSALKKLGADEFAECPNCDCYLVV